MKSSDGLILGCGQCLGNFWLVPPNLVIVARHGVGYDNVDLKAAADLGIVVTNTPGSIPTRWPNSPTVSSWQWFDRSPTPGRK